MAKREMGADLIAQQNGRFEPQRPFNFKVVLPGDLGVDADTYVAVESLTVPNQTVEPIIIPFLNEQRKVAGPITFENSNVVLVDYVEPDVAEQLHHWWDLVYFAATGEIGLARNYKKEMVLLLFGPVTQEGAGSFKREWKMIGCWPSQFNMNDFNMTTRGAFHKINMTLAVDRIEYIGQTGQGA